MCLSDISYSKTVSIYNDLNVDVTTEVMVALLSF